MLKPTMSSKSLEQWLAYLEACHPEEIDLGLERTVKVAQALDLTKLNCPVITVAGTNGKGSSIAYMQAILSAAGYKVGCYTSPHFLRYNERVSIAGKAVADDLLCTSFQRIEAARLELDIPLTYFEYGTLAALDIFKAAPLDVVLLEVGLGGRLDAVNIVDPDVAVVTTVALDHESWLGSDREKIGYEKAGIFRSGQVAVYGEADIPNSVADYARQLGTKLLRWGKDFHTNIDGSGKWSWYGKDVTGEPITIEGIDQPQLPFENALTSIQALQLLGLDIPTDAFRDGVRTASLTGRCQQVVYQNRTLILDVAHNPHAAAHLSKRIIEQGPVRCVLGMLGDKDIASTLEKLRSCVNHWYPATLKEARGQSADFLSDQLRRLAVGTSDISVSSGPIEALLKAINDSKEGDRILVAGSFYTVAEVLEHLEEERT